ncbi:MAG: RsmD family RNA methyltransferase [Dehalococcoidales bacterium]|nr:RsmD family RNA methyltransferase [Dehalococcoidales bacterium]
MRVITGKAKGSHLRMPKGPTRPATDLVKGAIFSILENMTEDWDKVLDLFSGSGGLGIEALSRGAGWVDFIDREPKVCDTIKENLEKTKLSEYSHVYCAGVGKAISFLDKEYSIILCDPPYKNAAVGSLLQQLADSKLVGPNTIVIATYPEYRPLGPAYGTLKSIKEVRHGDSCIAVYRRDSTA